MEDEADVLPEEPALDEDELLAGADSLDTPLPMVLEERPLTRFCPLVTSTSLGIDSQ